MDISRDIPPEQSLIEYPCHFPIKVMGAQVEGFCAAIAHVASQFDPSFDASTIERPAAFALPPMAENEKSMKNLPAPENCRNAP